MIKEPAFIYSLGRFLERQGLLKAPLNRIESRLLQFVMEQDSKEEFEKIEMQTKWELFLQMPEVYREVYPEDDPKQAHEPAGAWDIPESPDDVQRMLSDIKKAGIL